MAALVDSLVAKTRAWEQDRGIPFTYDGVPLLAMLDEYAMLRQDREEEKRRMRVSLTSDCIPQYNLLPSINQLIYFCCFYLYIINHVTGSEEVP